MRVTPHPSGSVRRALYPCPIFVLQSSGGGRLYPCPSGGGRYIPVQRRRAAICLGMVLQSDFLLWGAICLGLAMQGCEVLGGLLRCAVGC